MRSYPLPFRSIVCGVLVCAGLVVSAASMSAPKEGLVREFTFTESRIFPGTARQGVVWIPAQYDGSKPACVYVRQDGYDPGERPILEALIASGEMPVTVEVAISPGQMPAPVSGTIGRRNRCLEYDAMDDAYARFLTEEILPFVARTLNLNLSTSGNDRCIAGGSSGGIAAFNAAWQRPDAFTRVYCNSGSFVAFRGGNEYSTLVRKTEAKPVRAYMTTGTHDMENCAGDWFLLDQEVAKALEFAGYEHQFHMIDGPHVVGWMAHFADAMRYIWKGWPEPVRTGHSGPRVQAFVVEGKGWELAADGLGDARGPACNSRGEVFFVDAKADHIQRIGRDGSISTFVQDAGHAEGLTVGPHDELYAISSATGKITSYDDAGPGHVVAEGIRGRYLAARPDGSLYVTEPPRRRGDASKVWLVKGGRRTVVDTGLKGATGVTYRPDQWLLVVADGASKWCYSYRIAPDGTLAGKERFYWLHVPDWEDDAGVESVCYGRENQLIVATRMGVQVCSDDGPTQVILPLPDRARAMGLCLGGANDDTLYAFTGTRIWKRTVKAHAIGAFSPRVGVDGTPL